MSKYQVKQAILCVQKQKRSYFANFFNWHKHFTQIWRSFFKIYTKKNKQKIPAVIYL